jgi:hypothetical protein
MPLEDVSVMTGSGSVVGGDNCVMLLCCACRAAQIKLLEHVSQANANAQFR